MPLPIIIMSRSRFTTGFQRVFGLGAVSTLKCQRRGSNSTTAAKGQGYTLDDHQGVAWTPHADIKAAASAAAARAPHASLCIAR